MLTQRQYDLLVFIDHRLTETGCSPSFDEMKDAIKLKTKSGICRLISALEEHGFITRLHNRARAISVLRPPKDRGAPDVIGGGSSSHLVLRSDICTADSLAVPELPQAGSMAAGLPMNMLSEAAERTTTPRGLDKQESRPFPQAVQITIRAVRQGLSLTDVMRHPEIVNQITKLARLLVVHGLIPMEPGPLAARPDTARDMTMKLPQHPGKAGSIGGPRHAQQHVLVVDDAPDVLITVRAFLVGAGFVVMTAADGDMALRLIASDPLIGVLVTDFAMPGLSGVDLIAQSQQIRPGLKTLLITGFPNADGLAELPLHVTVLTKPFHRERLIEQIKILVGETWPADSDELMENAAPAYGWGNPEIKRRSS